MTPDELVRRTQDHYRDRFARHGAAPGGVDWNGDATQRTNFRELARVLAADRPFTVNDLGCGYGAFVDWLDETRPGACVGYRGYDVNPTMIDAARRRFAARDDVAFAVADRPLETADFGVASGIYTLRLGRGDAECLAYLEASLDTLDATSTDGFAFNCLTSWSDADRMRDDLWYPDPCVVFAHCKRRYAKNVALLHDYGLYAFTIVVRKRIAGP